MAEEVSALTPKLGRPPGLGVLLVGDDAASQVYVRNKELAATKAKDALLDSPSSCNRDSGRSP